MPTRSDRPLAARSAGGDSLVAPQRDGARQGPRRRPEPPTGATRPSARARPGRSPRAVSNADNPNTPVTLASCATGVHRHLAVAQQHPGKAAKDRQASILGRHPDGRRKPEPRAAAGGRPACAARGRRRRETARGRQPAGRRSRPPTETRCRQNAPSRRWSSTPCRQSRPPRSASPAETRDARAPDRRGGAPAHSATISGARATQPKAGCP